ncbi:MAG: sigma 54-interacting transcriptional regulator [Desulfovibrionaceae bacterium]
MPRLNILAATDNADAVAVLKKSLSTGARLDTASSRASLEVSFPKKTYDFVFIDIGILRTAPDTANSVKSDLQFFWRTCPSAQIVVMAQPERLRAVVDIVKAGASNYLTYPLSPEEVSFVVHSLSDMVQMESELRYLRGSQSKPFSSLISSSRNPAMHKALEKMTMVATTKSLVLLTGETGTGKSVFARFLHDLSPRADRQFIGVHCGAIPDTLLESELFGHEKGAFTGAVRRKLGKFEIANGGTLFLDEIGTITPPAQVKLLQVLQERTFQRVGGDTNIETDARIIAATNNDLKAMVDAGMFRNDLFYRLNVFPIEIPPLRERKEDIPLLVNAFLKKLTREYGKDINDVHPTVLDAFTAYNWPGNVRELENLMERAYILETAHVLTPESFPCDLFSLDVPAATIPLDLTMTLAAFREGAKENAERQYLKEVLAQCKGKVNLSASRAGITPRQLHKLLTRYGISKADYK